jgi:hypothetical protein
MQTTTVGTAPEVSLFNALITMFHQPSRAFAMLEARRAPWFPLLMLLISQLIIVIWYFQVVDAEFLTSSMASASQGAMGQMGKGALEVMAVVSALIGLPLLAVLRGVYFLIVDKVMDTGVDFGKGASLALWAWVPSLLLLPLGAVQIILHANGQLSMSDMNPLSLNQLFFQLPLTNKWAPLLDGVSVILGWEMVLMVIGYQAWAKVSRVKAACIALLPYLVVYGPWLAYLASKHA